MKSGWQQRQRQEQILLLGVGLLLLMVLLNLQVLQPLRQHWQQLKTQTNRLETQLAWMQQEAPKLMAEGSDLPPVKGAGDVLPDVLNRTASSWQLKLVRIEPLGSKAQLTLDGPLPFEKLVSWCEQLNEQYGVSVARIEIEASQTPSMVLVKQLVFTRP